MRIGSADTWRPLGARIIPAREVVAGDLLAFNHQVWRVLETSLRDDPARPYRIVTRPIKVETIQTHHDSDRHTVWARYSMAYTFPDEHYPVCVKCFEPLPCREQIIQKAMNESQQRTRRYETPNVCPACQEPITNRQLRQTWPENLIALTGQPVTIHLRRECVDEAKRYDQLWTDAGRMSQLGFDARKETP